MKFNLFAATFLFLVLTALDSNASAQSTLRWLQNRASQKCMDASDYGRGVDVYQWQCYFAAHHMWDEQITAGGLVTLRNVASGKCLDASDWGRGLNVIQFDCHDGDNQRWRWERIGNDDWALRNVASGKCLDASDWGNGLNLIQWDCHYAPNQLWGRYRRPIGSYAESCDCAADTVHLWCSCENGHGGAVDTVLFAPCYDGITNCGGLLQCGGC